MRKISVVVTTKSKLTNLKRLMKSIQKNRQIHEIILVDAGTPGAKEFSYKYNKIKYYNGEGTNRSEGKNLGIRNSTGDIIAFLDDDTSIANPNWSREILKSIDKLGIVAGYSPNPEGKGLPRVSIDINGQDITLPTCNLAVKKEVFEKIGMFDPDLVTGEDIDFNFRAIQNGFGITYNPEMKVYHYHREKFRGFAKQAFWNGYGRKQLNKKYPELKKLHQTGLKFKSIMRLGFGAMGYMLGGIFDKT